MKDIVLVTRRTHFLYDIVYQQQHIVVIQMHAFLMDRNSNLFYINFWSLEQVSFLN